MLACSLVIDNPISRNLEGSHFGLQEIGLRYDPNRELEVMRKSTEGLLFIFRADAIHIQSEYDDARATTSIWLDHYSGAIHGCLDIKAFICF